jgi:hypothetical protein
MDFSLSLDPDLFSSNCFASESSLEFLASCDFDLFEGLNLDPSIAFRTAEPSGMTDSVSSSSNPCPITSLLSSPETTLSSYSSDTINQSAAPLRRRQRQKRSSSADPRSSLKQHYHGAHDTNRPIKRHQTKLACSWCRKLGKKCDEQRPCSRCVRFDRCSECIDAPPRTSSGKVGERGTYKKTRDLATVDYQGAVQKRRAYVAKQGKLGRTVNVGLTPDDILQKSRQENAKMTKTAEKFGLAPFIDETSVRNRLSPVAGLSEEFMWSDFPGKDADLERSFISLPKDTLSDTSATDITSSTELDATFHVKSWQYQTIDMFPNLLGLIAAARAVESIPNTSDDVQSRSEIALTI